MQGSTATEIATIKASGPLSTRRAWHITNQGDMSSLRLVDEAMPALHSGEVLVEVRTLGLNFAGAVQLHMCTSHRSLCHFSHEQQWPAG